MAYLSLAFPQRLAQRLSDVLPQLSACKGIGLGLVLPVLLLLAWQIASLGGLISPQILPAPREVWRALLDLWHSGDFALHGMTSLQRILGGFLIGAALGLASLLEAIFMPAIRAVAQVPLIGWLPFLIIIAGLGEAPKIIIIAKAAFLPIALNSFEGVRAIPKQYFEMAESFRFNRRQSLTHIVLPGALGQIFTGLRYGLTKSWTALVAVELLASTEGLGYLIDRLFEKVESHMQRWRPEQLI